MTQNDSANLEYFLKENKKNNVQVSYEEILHEVDILEMLEPEIQYIYENDTFDIDNYLALELDYQTNYIKKDLERIADYYEISKRKKRKYELVGNILLYEKNPVNLQKVYQRKKLWKYIEEIKKDKYLSQFLILD